MIISEFRGQYSFLSNFFNAPMLIDGKTYQTNEHYFQTMKTNNEKQKEWVRTSPTASQAKSRGRKVDLRLDWENIKDDIMLTGLANKFMQNEDLKYKLIATGNNELQEGNMWHDNYWGICHCNKCQGKYGKNKLGKMLMELRQIYLENI